MAEVIVYYPDCRDGVGDEDTVVQPVYVYDLRAC